jgi:hypothetical protein
MWCSSAQSAVHCLQHGHNFVRCIHNIAQSVGGLKFGCSTSHACGEYCGLHIAIGHCVRQRFGYGRIRIEANSVKLPVSLAAP